MSPDALKQRFHDEIRLRAYNDAYIDRNEEREILQIAIHQGFPLDEARAALAQICRDEQYVLESSLARLMEQEFRTILAARGAIDRSEFDRVIDVAASAAGGRRQRHELQRLAVTVIDDLGPCRIRSGWFHNWFRSLKRKLAAR